MSYQRMTKPDAQTSTVSVPGPSLRRLLKAMLLHPRRTRRAKAIEKMREERIREWEREDEIEKFLESGRDGPRCIVLER